MLYSGKWVYLEEYLMKSFCCSLFIFCAVFQGGLQAWQVPHTLKSLDSKKLMIFGSATFLVGSYLAGMSEIKERSAIDAWSIKNNVIFSGPKKYEDAFEQHPDRPWMTSQEQVYQETIFPSIQKVGFAALCGGVMWFVKNKINGRLSKYRVKV